MSLPLSLSLSPASKLSPPLSPSVESREDWTLLNHDAEPASQAPVSTTHPPVQPTSPLPATTNSGTKLGGKLANTFNFKMFKPGKRSQSESGSLAAKDEASKRNVQQPGTQTCYKCKVVRTVQGVVWAHARSWKSGIIQSGSGIQIPEEKYLKIKYSNPWVQVKGEQ